MRSVENLGQNPVQVLSIEIRRFRNLNQVFLQLDGASGWFYGDNGAGKTSILDALVWLSTGKAGRRVAPHAMIQNHEGQVCVSAVTGPAGRESCLGASRDRVEVRRWLGQGLTGPVCHQDSTGDSEARAFVGVTQRELARAFPVLEYSSATVDQLAGAPDGRRRWIDFGAFHGSAAFSEQWSRWRLLLRQRNAALRMHRCEEFLDAVDPMLAELGEEIDAMRRRFVERLEVALREEAGFNAGDIALHWRSGWSRDRTLHEALLASREEDIRRGSTTRGVHRGDLRFQVQGRDFGELSRGQQRRFAMDWFFAVHRSTESISLLVLDDPFSELDAAGVRQLGGLLRATSSQWLLTSVDMGPMAGSDWPGVKVFHVEHGRVVSRET